MATMVDSKLAKSVQKSVGRAKEKILQNLGKVDRTADEIFDDHVSNFNKQQYAATRLQKELNNYIRCIRACAGASHALLEAVGEVYEPEWGEKELVSVNSQASEILWNDFAHRLAEQVLIPLNTYQGQFPEMRKKIEKRGRKLVDYDGERHALQALQSNPRRGEAKLARQRESLEAAKRTYEVLNLELHEELPGLYASRVVFLVSAMSTLFASENIFHSEASKVFSELETIVDRLSKESAKGALVFKHSSSNAALNTESPKEGLSLTRSEFPSKPIASVTSVTPSPSSPETHSSSPTNNPSLSDTKEVCGSSNIRSDPRDEHLYANVMGGASMTNVMANADCTVDLEKPAINSLAGSVSDGVVGSKSNSITDPPSDSIHENPNGNNVATTALPAINAPPSSPLHDLSNKNEARHGNEEATDLNANPSVHKPNTNSNFTSHPAKHEPGVLYRVRSTYRYQKEDVDELSFEAGEVIDVIEYEDPDEQEEGWLMGVKENGDKGMFPANFTRPL